MKWWHDDVSELPISPLKKELYNDLDKLLKLHEDDTIDFNYMLDMMEQRISEYKKKCHSPKT